MSGVGPGWYADPEGRPHERYWDGMAWTEQTRPLVAASPAGYGTAVGVGYRQAGNVPQNGLGVASLVLGILGVLILPIVFSVLAIIFGSVGIARANRGVATNKGVATAGLVLGIIGIILGIVIGIALFS